MEIIIPVHHEDDIQLIFDAVCEADPSAAPEPVDMPAVRGDRLSAGYDENEGGVVVWGDATREELLRAMPQFAIEKHFEFEVSGMIGDANVRRRVVEAYRRALSTLESAVRQRGTVRCLEAARGSLYAAALEMLEAAVESALETAKRGKRPTVVYSGFPDDLSRVL